MRIHWAWVVAGFGLGVWLGPKVMPAISGARNRGS